MPPGSVAVHYNISLPPGIVAVHCSELRCPRLAGGLAVPSKSSTANCPRAVWRRTA